MIYGKHVKVSLKHHWEIASIIRCYGALEMIYRNYGTHTSYILIDFFKCYRRALNIWSYFIKNDVNLMCAIMRLDRNPCLMYLIQK